MLVKVHWRPSLLFIFMAKVLSNYVTTKAKNQKKEGESSKQKKAFLNTSQ